ncbi:hypothetical protein S40285_08903 [Stachybotrys chlorohalonatus IBT 40285]|uniref:Uncharacterized protein n=1 Tax=Stachybotrys chlorohalonatus (strain IBT 40285) TaxID=1283841 RepID=A0A084R2X5_STAC4|nr:hypothetical protein S40285_08903 [Stachybotrys chlorohalonata IBT 40285]
MDRLGVGPDLEYNMDETEADPLAVGIVN